MKKSVAVALTFALLLPAASEAQLQAKAPRIGVLSSLTPDAPRAAALREGLARYGYTEGVNLAIEWRPSFGNAERFRELAVDLVSRKVDLIIAADNPAISAARAATTTIPIVMVSATDPVSTGFVSSLARPGGNVTGLTVQAPEVQGKVLQLLKEALPKASRIAVLWDPREPGREVPAKEAVQAARTLGLHAALVPLRSAAELDATFKRMSREKYHAAIVQPGQVMFAQRKRIAELAAANGIATMAWSDDVAQAGMLMSYGANLPDLYRRSGYYVDRILKGAKPSELPVEQPTRFELTVNLKTAKRLGITLPQAIVVRADRVIE
jgi:putative ABC transport system substrate-binding protein